MILIISWVIYKEWLTWGQSPSGKELFLIVWTLIGPYLMQSIQWLGMLLMCCKAYEHLRSHYYKWVHCFTIFGISNVLLIGLHTTQGIVATKPGKSTQEKSWIIIIPCTQTADMASITVDTDTVPSYIRLWHANTIGEKRLLIFLVVCVDKIMMQTRLPSSDWSWPRQAPPTSCTMVVW